MTTLPDLFRVGLTALLVYLAVHDFHTRLVPNWATLPLLFGGALWHLLGGAWLVPLVLALVLLASERRIPLAVALILVPGLLAFATGTTVLIGVAWLTIWLLWEMHILGGGDAKLAMGLVGLFPTMEFVWLMLAASLLGSMAVLLIKHRWRVFAHVAASAVTLFGGALPTRDELETNGQPMAFVYAAAGIAYVWWSRGGLA